MVKDKDMQFCMENLKMKSLTFRSRDLKPRFSVIFPSMISIFREDKGDGIKSRQPSIIFSTLLNSIVGRNFCSPLQQYIVWFILHFLGRMAGVNEVIGVYLMAKKLNVPVCPNFLAKQILVILRKKSKQKNHNFRYVHTLVVWGCAKWCNICKCLTTLLYLAPQERSFSIFLSLYTAPW